MVASANSDPYTPFPQGLMLEEGLSSSEGSGLHSPIFASSFPHPDMDGNLRYRPDQFDPHPKSILASQFDYNIPPSLVISQVPILDSPLETAAQHLHCRSEFPLPPRTQLRVDYAPLPSPSNPRLLPPPSQGGPVEFSLPSSSHRVLTGEHPHDQLHSSSSSTITGTHMDSFSSSSVGRPDTSSSSNAPTGASNEIRRDTPPVIACRQCRARKIRCDSTRPVCNNCVRRSNPCEYDAVPKRRGPDKRPGTRQRSCKKRPSEGGSSSPTSKRKRSAPVDEELHPTTKMQDSKKRRLSPSPNALNVKDDGYAALSGHESVLSRIPELPSLRNLNPQGVGFKSERSILQRPSSPPHNSDPYYKAAPAPHRAEGNVMRTDRTGVQGTTAPDPPAPSMDFRADVWWDDLLRSYTLENIVSDFSDLFESTIPVLSFLNIRLLRDTIYNPEERLKMQPSFILSGLAMTLLIKSGETELGSSSVRSRAVLLRDRAQLALEMSWSKRWLNPLLAQAALILALFDCSSHHRYDPDRAESSIISLDNVIRASALCSIDSNDPLVSVFPPHSVPLVNARPSRLGRPADMSDHTQASSRHCACIPQSSANISDSSYSRSRSYSWDPTWSDDEVRREQIRRLCWSSLNLVTMHASQCLMLNRQPPDLFLSDPAHYRILFPGEISELSSSYISSHILSPKESIWALHCRSMLLWNFSHRLRKDNSPTDGGDEGQLALKASAEAQAILDLFDMHTCRFDEELISVSREYLYGTQMMVTQWFRRFVRSSDNGDNLNRQQAEAWLYNQDDISRRAMSAIHHIGQRDGETLTRRPYLVGGFAAELFTCLSLWHDDRSFLKALDQAKSILMLLDVLNMIWPCPWQMNWCEELRNRLNDACAAAGRPLPGPTEFSIPSRLRT